MEPEEREEAQGFIVSDKRLFTQDGERRETDSQSAPMPAPPPLEPTPVAEERPSAPEPVVDRGDDAIDFSAYLIMLANTVMMLLGQVPDPNTQQRYLDLPQAKHNIDILMLLREKTQGNVTADEHQLLEEMLPQLQMAYTSISQQAGQPGQSMR